MLLDRIQHLEEQLARHPSDQYHHSPQTSEARHSPEHRDQLVDRISELEAQLARTASGEPHVDHQSRGYEIETLESKVAQMEQRLEAAEKELRESEEARRSEKAKAVKIDQMLKDREELLAHAKEMWLKESGRASKLAEALTQTEDRLADQEKRLQEVSERYNEAASEVRQLRHLLDGSDGGAGAGSRHGANEFRGGPMDSFGGGFGERGFGPEATDYGANGRHLPPATSGALSTVPRSHGALGAGPSNLGHGSHPRSVVPPRPEDCDTNSDRFRHLLMMNDAVLSEDELLQIGIKADYQGCEGQVSVFFGNKGNAPLQSFTVQYFVREENALRLVAAPCERSLEPHDQIVQQIRVTCIEPFTEVPLMRVQFLLPDASSRRVQVKFPVALTKFMRGRELEQREFFHTWRQQHFVLNEVSSVVNLSPKLGSQPVHIARGLVFGGALRLHHGFDNDPQNFVLVGQLHERPGSVHRRDAAQSGLGDLGDHELGLSLVRVEIGAGRFSGKARVVIRSSNRTVGQALSDLIGTQLSIASHLGDVLGR